MPTTTGQITDSAAAAGGTVTVQIDDPVAFAAISVGDTVTITDGVESPVTVPPADNAPTDIPTAQD
jgi:hypothetical protein